LAHSRVPHLLPIPAGLRTKHSDSVCYKFHDKSSYVGRSPSKASSVHTTYCAMFWCRISEGALQVSTFWGTSTSPSPRLAWFLVGPAPNQMETAYDCAKKTRLPDMHKTQDVCELGATVLPFVWSLFGAASRPKPCRWLGFCEQKDLHGLTWKHKCGTQFDWQQALKKK
jgi:hypothetical protein